MRRKILAYVREKYQIEPVYPWKMQPGYAVLCHRYTMKWFAMLMNVEGSRIGLTPLREYDVINLRVPESEVGILLRRRGFLPAYHMAAREWVTILLDGTVPMEELLQLLDRSFRLTGEEAGSAGEGEKKEERSVPGKGPYRSGTRTRQEGEIHFGRHYKDQPLSAGAWNREESLPAKIREMKTLARPGRGVLEENIFYQQAVYMADYEDDFRYKGRFLRFYPTYQTMTSEQLRGYFGWRTRYRAGDTTLEQIPYIYLYLFETLCGIGSASPGEALEKLKKAAADFGDRDAGLKGKILLWIRDYVIYHGMDRALLPQGEEEDLSGALSVLLRFENDLRREAAEAEAAAGEAQTAAPKEIGEEEEIFDALCRIASYDLSVSAFYKKYPDQTRQAAVRVYRELCLARKDRKMTMVRKYFGLLARYPYRMFNGAVFYDPARQEDRDYEVNPALFYECRDGKWFSSSYPNTHEKNQGLGDICHEIDRQLRIQMGFRSVLKARLEEKAAGEQIERAIRSWLQEKEEEKKPRIEIDFSVLDRIREDADQTRDSLIVEEAEETESVITEGDRETEPVIEDDGRETEPAAESVSAAAGEEAGPDLLPGLTPVHRDFLRLLLNGGDWRGFVADHHLMLALLADEINEAFYEEIGDTVLEFDGADPALVEDYREDLEKFL